MKKGLLIIITFLFVACSNNKKHTPILKDSTGSVKHVLLVIDNDLWKGMVGEELRSVISEPVLGLPQPENQFSVSRIPRDAFKGMFKSNRNILYIEKADKDIFNIATNKFAQPQKIISVFGKTNESLVLQLKKNTKKMIAEFAKPDIIVIQKRQKRDERKGETFKTFQNLGVTMTVPHSFKTVDDTGDFLWLRHHLNKGRSIEMLVYEIPITSEEDILGNTIIENRNSIGEKYIPGDKEGMHMITEKAYAPYRFDAIIDGKKAYETRGKWEVEGDFMAGPFLNYTVVDKPNNRLIVVEGFVFAPAINKRNYMFEIEAMLKTLHIN